MSRGKSKFDDDSTDEEEYVSKSRDIDVTSRRNRTVFSPNKKGKDSSFLDILTEADNARNSEYQADNTGNMDMDDMSDLLYSMNGSNNVVQLTEPIDTPVTISKAVETKKEVPVIASASAHMGADETANLIHAAEAEQTTSFQEGVLAVRSEEDTYVAGNSEKVYALDIQEANGQIRIYGRAFDASSVSGDTAEVGTMATRSVCVIVDQVEREFFVLARRYKYLSMHTDTTHAVTHSDVYEEVRALLSARNIAKNSIKMKPVQKRYCFDRYPVSKGEEASLKDSKNIVPTTETEFQHFKYVGPVLGDIPSGVFFSHCFNTHTSLLETFMLGRQLNEGSCWLTIANANVVDKEARRSTCQQELRVAKATDVSKYRPGPKDMDLPVPLLTAVTLHLTTSLQGQQQHIVSAVVRVSTKLSLESVDSPHLQEKQHIILCPAPGATMPSGVAVEAPKQLGELTIAKSERILLQHLARQINLYDPDVIIGHELHGATGELLKAAVKRHSSNISFKVGRFPTAVSDKSHFWVFQTFAGRLLCDTAVSCREFYHTKKYDLVALAEVLFKRLIIIPDSIHTKDYFDKTRSTIALLLSAHRQVDLVFDLLRELQVLPLTKTLTEVCGNQLQMSFRAMRSKRIEQLLLHKFQDKNVIPPEDITAVHKEELRAKSDETNEEDDNPANKKGYAGGLVLEPKRGYYDTWVSVLDFNSLYPSIIREYDICHSTLRHWEDTSNMESLQALLDNKVVTNDSVLPDVMKSLIEKRKYVKKMINTAKEKDLAALNIRQLALKLVANAMYGCLGFSHSRFYCQPLAAIITMKGRQALTFAVDSATKLNRSIIYGDTDSIMVNTHTTNYAEARKASTDIQKVVNNHFKLLKIDEDGYFANMLLLRKKKYAALKLTTVEAYSANQEPQLAKEWEEVVKKTGRARVRKADKEQNSVFMLKREVKGLDLVRRDWCALSRNTCTKIVDIILQGLDTDACLELIEHLLTDLRLKLQEGKIDYKEFLLTKSLTKSLDQYDGKTNQVHVSVAHKMKNDGQIVRAGDVIEYFVQEEPGKAVHERALSHSQFLSKGKPALDIAWYVQNQLFEPVWRLLETFTISKDRVGEWLGASVHTVHTAQGGAERQSGSQELPTVCTIFDQEQAVYVDCPKCGVKFPFLGVFNYVPVHSFKQPNLTLQFEAPSSSTVPLLMHGSDQYRSKVAAFAEGYGETHGFICPTPNCSGPLSSDVAANKVYADMVCNSLTLRIESILAEYQKHQQRYKVGEDSLFTCTDLRVKEADKPLRLVTSEDVLDKLRYIAWLFDTESAALDLLKELQARKAAAVEVEDKASPIASYINKPVMLAKTTTQDSTGNTVYVVDLKECFDENRKVVVLAPITKDLSEATKRVFTQIHKHVRSYLLACEKYHIKLASLMKINVKSTQ